MTSTIVALDLETTGLDPDRHHIWEVGAIVRDHRDDRYNGEWHMLMRPDLAVADPVALRVGRYYERAPQYLDRDVRDGTPAWVVSRPSMPLPGVATPAPPPVIQPGRVGRRDVARVLAVMLDGAHLVAANPAFDAAFLTQFLRSHGQAPSWHYHLVDVQALAVGYFAGRCAAAMDEEPRSYPHSPGPFQIVPWKSAEISAGLGIEQDETTKHTAVGDARWALAVYDAIRTSTGKDGA